MDYFNEFVNLDSEDEISVDPGCDRPEVSRSIEHAIRTCLPSFDCPPPKQRPINPVSRLLHECDIGDDDSETMRGSVADFDDEEFFYIGEEGEEGGEGGGGVDMESINKCASGSPKFTRKRRLSLESRCSQASHYTMCSGGIDRDSLDLDSSRHSATHSGDRQVDRLCDASERKPSWSSQHLQLFGSSAEKCGSAAFIEGIPRLGSGTSSSSPAPVMPDCFGGNGDFYRLNLPLAKGSDTGAVIQPTQITPPSFLLVGMMSGTFEGLRELDLTRDGRGGDSPASLVGCGSSSGSVSGASKGGNGRGGRSGVGGSRSGFGPKPNSNRSCNSSTADATTTTATMTTAATSAFAATTTTATTATNTSSSSSSSGGGGGRGKKPRVDPRPACST